MLSALKDIINLVNNFYINCCKKIDNLILSTPVLLLGTRLWVHIKYIQTDKLDA